MIYELRTYWAAPGKLVTVNFAAQTKTVRVGSDGKWQVKLSRMKASWKPETFERTSAVT